MKTLEQELNRIKNELADIGCKTMFGKTCEELVQEIITNVVKLDLKSTNQTWSGVGIGIQTGLKNQCS